MKNILFTNLVIGLLAGAGLVQAQTLKGSPESIERQYRAAISYGYAFVDTARSVQRYVGPGELVRVSPDRYLELHDVSYPYARPGARVFLSRLSNQYHNACGEKLTVTSLLRPRDRQPANSVARSVHPTGMAIDLRVPKTQKCRSWLESTLLSLERDRVLDVTRERYPPHYHVALFVKKYESRLGVTSSPTQMAAADTRETRQVAAVNSRSAQQYAVRRGDTLSEIAKLAGVSVSQLKAANGLRGHRIYSGQKLRIPTTGSSGNNMVGSDEIMHRVNRGDTLWRIANLYGTSVKQLRNVNGQASDFLQVGQVLRVTKG